MISQKLRRRHKSSVLACSLLISVLTFTIQLNFVRKQARKMIQSA